MIRLFLGMILLSRCLLAEDAPLSAEARKEMLATFEQSRKEADAALAKEPASAEWLTRRGDARLFLGDAKGAVADFEREIALEPSHDAPHWRLVPLRRWQRQVPRNGRCRKVGRPIAVTSSRWPRSR